MRKIHVLLIVAALAAPVFAQTRLPEYKIAAGNWVLTADRLYQNNAAERLSKVSVRVPQKGKMVYEFNVRYEKGAEDGQGGFGVHLFADSATDVRSWGAGKSYLLWLNYDEKPVSKEIPKGFSAQIYKSVSNSKMELVQSIDLNAYAYLITPQVLASTIPVKLWVDGDTGEVRVYDPTKSDYYYFVKLGKDFSKSGDWIALRTNGMKLSVGLPR